ncbi:MAG TPA: NAD-dependent epimerase/dehydratase family protein [Streptosporangiaceae bacterium]|nr:NAD-dependent epimerase/dehydratase family protein [Streptosporangiaceae bacterium]
MRLLIIGGTAFVGRYIAEAALADGHEVTLFNRGRTNPDLFPRATHLTGDRNDDLSALAGREWDATIDVCAYFPRQVHELARTLGAQGGHTGRGGHHIYVSSMSAYKTPVARGFTEDAPLAELDDPDTEAMTNENYGGLKVACERLAARMYGESNTAIVRPTYVIGPHDRSYRMTYWVERIAAGGAVLAAAGKADPIQVIDARDMGSWIVGLAVDNVSGAFSAVSPPPPFGFGDLLDAISQTVAPPDTELIWVSKEFMVAQGEAETLPLWPGGDSESDINAADPAAAAATGLKPRPLSQTISEIHAAELANPRPARPEVGLKPEREAELISLWLESGKSREPGSSSSG